jgi:hypothetical protein
MGLFVQSVAGAAQFTGLAGAGLFTWSSVELIPRTTRVFVHTVGIHINGAAAPVTELVVRLRNPASGDLILLGRGLAADIVGPAPLVDGADFTLTCWTLPRLTTGEHFELQVFSLGKTATGTIQVDWSLQPWPDTSERDGPLL